MAHYTRQKPPRGRGILHRALKRRLRRGGAVAGSDKPAKIAEPLPVYRLTRDGAKRAKPLTRARRVGWRYPLLLGKTACLAYLREARGSLRFAGVTEGLLPRRLFEAVPIAERELGTIDRGFQPRFLEIPSLRFYALWLHARAGESRVVALLAPEAVSSDLRTERQFARDIKALLSRRRAKLASPVPGRTQ